VRERAAPCGQPLPLERERNLGWIENGDTITPDLTDVSAGGTLRLGAGAAAGDVSLDPSFVLGPGESVVVISLGIAPQGRMGFQRTILPTPAGHPVPIRFPAGHLLAVHLDAHGDALAVSRPQLNPPSGAVTLSIRRASEGVDVLAFVDRSSAGKPEPVSLAAVDSAGRHLPHVITDGPDRLIAAWYGLAGGALQVTAESEALFLPGALLQARPREALLLRATLRPLPKLTVAIGSLPDGTKAPAMTLSLFKAGQPQALRQLSVKPGESAVIDRLPAALFDVALDVGGFRTGTRADLSSGEDARVEIPLHPITVKGMVEYGHDPARAEIRIIQRGEPLVATTDDGGRYTLTLWAPGRFFVDTVLLDRPELPPFRDVVRFEESRTYDIHIPALRLALRVFDADGNTPLPAATIELRNTYVNPETERQATNVLSVTTAAAPITELPPLHLGQAEATVRAAGYETAGPIAFAVDTAVAERIIDVPMKRVADSVPLRIVLPDGSPAAGAEVATASPSMTLTWTGLAGVDGIARLPKTLGGSYLLIRHAAGASSLTRLPATYEAVTPISLEPSAPPLTIRFVESDGKPIGPAPAYVALWYFSGRVTGPVLAFLSWSSATTLTDGTWTARNLTAGYSVRVVASRRGGFEALKSGLFDGQAAAVAYPWPAIVTLHPAD
jgi:hypothetical protein